MQFAPLPAGRKWDLPPVILHPFADPTGPERLVESSRAQLMMQGLLPCGELSPEELQKRFLSGRFCEIRMLYFVGKDLERWIEQCVEMADRDDDLRSAGAAAGSFIELLINNPTPDVRDKLTRWGVADYKSIFSRALGVKAVFDEPPAQEQLTAHFIRFYYRFADHLFACRQHNESFSTLPPDQFHFDLYASGEYSRMLEREWEEI
jgi:hypothetical protein